MNKSTTSAMLSRATTLGRRASHRHYASIGAFERHAASHWTSDRLAWLSNGRDLPLSPDKPGTLSLLRVLGLLNADGSFGAEKLKKYRQINAMLEAVERALALPLQHRVPHHGPLRVVDLCTGSSSHLALLEPLPLATVGSSRFRCSL